MEFDHLLNSLKMHPEDSNLTFDIIWANLTSPFYELTLHRAI